MTIKNSSIWSDVLDAVDYAFQPIVNIHTGLVYGYEALIRHVDRAGFVSIAHFFDSMHQNHTLGEIHQHLLIKALKKFHQIPWADQVKLFYNLDGRLLGARNFSLIGPCLLLTPELRSHMEKICLEISERHEICSSKCLIEQFKQFRSTGCKIAVDDFGTGFAGNHILYFAKPEYVKIDRFYIENIENDAHKRMLATSMVNIAHLMGSLVIAEGVETEKEYYCCKAIGCDLLQGYLVQKPELQSLYLKKVYETIQRLADEDRRKPNMKDQLLIQSEIDYFEPILYDAEPIAILEVFKRNRKNTFFPVVNHQNEALGIIREETVKEYAYSEYGRCLLANPTTKKTVGDFMSRIPIVEIHTPIETILECFSAGDDSEGIIITNSVKYVGILRAQSLLRIVTEKKIANAIDQNPLSNLPGNKLIYEYVSNALQDNSETYIIVYFDFDNFKVYNDTYGFRQGDRVIQLFAQLLKARASFDKRFVGHIGGDDFFMGLKGVPLPAIEEEVGRIAEKFSISVESFYDTDTLRRGSLIALDRDGCVKSFPLMSVSAAIMELPVGLNRIYSPEEIAKMMARMKKKAKASASKICMSTLKHFDDENDLHTADPDDTVIILSSHRKKAGPV